MGYALSLQADGRILSVTYPRYAPAATVVDRLPEGNVADYLYIDGAYMYDPLPAPETPAEPTQEERIADLEEALELLLSGVTE